MAKKTLAEQLASRSIDNSAAAVVAATSPAPQSSGETIRVQERVEHAQTAAETALIHAISTSELAMSNLKAEAEDNARAVIAAEQALVVAQAVEPPAIDHAAAMERNLDAAARAEWELDDARLLAHREARAAYVAACDARMEYEGDDEATMVRLLRAKKAARVILDAAEQAISFSVIIKALKPYASRIPVEGIAIRLVDGNIQIVNAPFLVSGKIGNMESRIMTDHNSRRVPSPPASSSGSNPSPNPNGLKYIVQWPEIGENWVNSGEVVTYKSLTAAARDVQGMWKVESQVSGNAFWSVPTNYKGSPGESYLKNYKGWNFTLTIQ